jgi:hypothetical protein
MRALRARVGTVGRCCESGWTDLEGQARTASILELATRTQGASLDSTAPVGTSQTAPLHHDPDLAQAAIGDSTVQTGAPIGTHPTLDAMAGLRVLLHGTNL